MLPAVAEQRARIAGLPLRRLDHARAFTDRTGRACYIDSDRKPRDSPERQSAEGESADHVDHVDNAFERRKQKQTLNGPRSLSRGNNAR